MSDERARIVPENINVEALYEAHKKVCSENSALRRRVADLEDFLRGSAKQFGAMAGQP